LFKEARIVDFFLCFTGLQVLQAISKARAARLTDLDQAQWSG
jgi:hypothetical protein